MNQSMGKVDSVLALVPSVQLLPCPLIGRLMKRPKSRPIKGQGRSWKMKGKGQACIQSSLALVLFFFLSTINPPLTKKTRKRRVNSGQKKEKENKRLRREEPISQPSLSLPSGRLADCVSLFCLVSIDRPKIKEKRRAGR